MDVVLSNDSCIQYAQVFVRINSYYRDEMVLNGTEYASAVVGYAITAAYALVILFGTMGNALTIFVVLQNANMRTTRNFFILNLALSDFFVCTVTAPITLYTIRYMFWPFGTTLCKIAGSMQGFNVFLSTFSITAIALDRYVLVIFPTKRERQQRLSLLFFLLIWVISLVLAIPLLIASDVNVLYEDKPCGIKLQICHEQNIIWDRMIITKQAYTLSVLAVQYAFPLVSLVFAYSRIVNRMKLRFPNREVSTFSNRSALSALSERRRSIAERQRRTHLLLICIVGMFACAWLPLNVFHIVNTFQIVQQFSVSTFAVCHLIAMCSACLNPVSYAFFNQNIRTEFINLLQNCIIRRLWRRIFNREANDKDQEQTVIFTQKEGKTSIMNERVPEHTI